MPTHRRRLLGLHVAVASLASAAGCLEKIPGYGDDSGSGSSGADGGTPSSGSGADGTADGGSATGTGSTTSPGSTTGGADASSTGEATTADPTGTGTTSGTGSSSGTDSTTGGGAAKCSESWSEPGWSFETPIHLMALSWSGFDGDPYLTADGLTLYFASDRPGFTGGSNVFYTVRPDLDSPFGAVVPFADLNTDDSEWTFAPTEDGLLAYYNTNRPGTGNADIWQVTRSSTGMPWGSPRELTELNGPGAEWDAFTMPDGLTLYYNVGGSDADNYVATRPSRTQPFDPGTPLANNTTSVESTPTLTADGLVIVWGSNRAETLGSGDLFYQTRPTATSSWGPVTAVPVVNTAQSEGESHLRYDGCELFYSAGPAGAGIAGWDLYVTKFVRP